MEVDLELEKKLQSFLLECGKKWAMVLTHPSEKMLKKYSYLLLVKDYVFKCTHNLDDTDFDYSLATRIHWTLNHLDDFPKCKFCGKPISQWNLPTWKDSYKSTCCKECERKYAQQNSIKHFKSKYGVENAFQIPAVIKNIKDQRPQINEKVHATHHKNNTFQTSSAEDRAGQRLKSVFGDEVKRQHSTDKYPFKCDYYIPSIDTYIELNYSWTHGGRPFDPCDIDCQKQLQLYQNKSTSLHDYYANAIETWTIRDVKKLEYAKRNSLNYQVFWNEADFNTWLAQQIPQVAQSTLRIPYSQQKLESEFKFFSEYDPPEKHPKGCRKNCIIKYFQQDEFFKVEKHLWATCPDVRQQIIENRCKFLHATADKLSDLDLLEGFKKSGRFYGYSHFNSLLFSWFIKRFKAHICYDPCGGWGHRLLGGLKLQKYIYNDLSKATKENVDRIISHFGIQNAVTYCQDARTFVPKEDFDSMFTCPPYFNLEHYSCGDFNDRQDFDEFINALFAVFQNSKTCKTFGLVIREDMLGNHTDYAERYNLTVKSSHLVGGVQNRKREFLYVFLKPLISTKRSYMSF